MPRANELVQELLLEYAGLLSILADDPFKPRAYEKAAQAVSGYAADVSGLDPKGILAIPSVGKSIGEKVHEYLTTGAIAELDELRAKVPAGVRDMMRIPGLGPKKAMSLYTEVGVGSIDALLAAMDAGAQVINISLGGYDTNSVLSSAIGRATNAGIAIVASAGNDQLSGLTWPAADPRVISVGAVDGTGQQVTFSNSGPSLSLTAPGYGVPTAWSDGQRVQMDGTSASAPLVAGTIAAVLSQSSTLTGAEAAQIVQQHASDAGEPGADPNYGNGILNVGWTMNRSSSAYADTAVASTLYDPATGVASVVVQNRGNQMVQGLELRVTIGTTPTTLAVAGLAPGASATVPVNIDAAALQAAGQLNLGIQLVNPAGLPDQVPLNNRANGVVTDRKSTRLNSSH